VTVDQQQNGGAWNLLGTFTMAPGQNHRIVLSDNANGEVAADAVQVTRVGAPPSTATWLPSLPRADTYQVYERTPGYGTWTSTAPFTVFHQAGSTTTLVTEVTGGGTWKLLGTYDLFPGQNHRVELTDVVSTGSFVVADAVKFVPVASAKSASWSIPGSLIAATGSYQLYARWPASASHTPEAVYTIAYEGGTASVTVNQKKNGGQWNLLGTFPFNAGGSGYKVTLADSALGKVAADAIYIVQDVAPTAAFTWTPTFPSAGAYQVYARWPASSANTAAAHYTVTRDGGTSTATLSQKQNGGGWVPLGSYNFTPGSGQKVTLAASADGTTIADALLFVGAGAQPANLLYVHADHLGSPQKLTDASQATIWDGVFDPFGEEVAIAGLAAMPMRFPGQYADDETGFSYNYFRDYEPAIGKYIQSDPIGLRGGNNAYAYAANGPTIWIDPLGLYTRCMPGTIEDLTSPECQGPQQGGGGGFGGGTGGGPPVELVVAGVVIATATGVIAWLCDDADDEISEKDKDYCRKQFEHDQDKCYENYSFNRDALRGCLERASEIFRACMKGKPELPTWSDPDVDGVKFPPPKK
jgi:RHS repeat-associated protein